MTITSIDKPIGSPSGKNADKAPRVPAFRTALRCEWRLLRADPAFWAVLLLLVAAMFHAASAGARHGQQQARLVAAAQAEEAQRLATLRQQLKDVEAGTRVPASPFRDPRNALWVGLTHGAHTVAMRPAPLAVAAVGLSDLQPAVIKLSARTKDEFLFADEIRNPLHLLAGAVDIAFVLVFLLPLAILALGYNLVSAEREGGTLALTACSGTSVRRVLLAKLAARAGAPLGATLLALAAALGWAGVGPSWPVAGLVAITVLYAACWAALAGWVNSWRRDSAYNALALAGAWIGWVLVLPAAVNLLSDTLYPVPSRAQMVLAVRGASVDADKERNASLARYREEHPEAQPDELKLGSARERLQRRIAVVDAAAERVEAVVQLHDAQLERRQRLVDRLAFVSPALLMQLATADLAGTGAAAYSVFHARVAAFHVRWRDFFLTRARADQPLQAADYDAFPRFDAAQAAADVPAAALWPRLAGLALLALLLGAGACRGLRGAERGA